MTTPPPDPELKRLEPLLGSWRSEEHTQDSVLGPGTISVAWWLRDENGEWQPWMDNRFERVAG